MKQFAPTRAGLGLFIDKLMVEFKVCPHSSGIGAYLWEMMHRIHHRSYTQTKVPCGLMEYDKASFFHLHP